MKKIFFFYVATLLSIVAISQTNNTLNDSVYNGFAEPPDAAKPRVWWHWMNGNITKDGIRKDLEWMYRTGIGGFQNFDASLMTPQIVEKRLTYMTPEWQDAFQFTKLADSTFDKLVSYTENADAGIKYFSGTATYTKTITANNNWFTNNQQLWLDIGDVKNLAEVIVNGKSLGIGWKKPFRVDVTSALKPGSNTIMVKVTNLWVNRLIGDVQPGVTNKITYTTMPFYQASSPLLPSGLLGPVKILSINNQ